MPPYRRRNPAARTAARPRPPPDWRRHPFPRPPPAAGTATRPSRPRAGIRAPARGYTQ